MTWRGEMHCDLWLHSSHLSEKTQRDYAQGAVVCPLVQWYVSGAGGAQVAIKNEYHKYKHFAQDSENIPPPGWSRIVSSSTTGSSGLDGNHYYVTPCAPRRKFRHPIPLVDTSHTAVTIPTPTSNIITCQTERAYFYLAGQDVKDNLSLWADILDTKGSKSGMMFRSGDAPEPTKLDQKVELIAVSMSLEGNLDAC
jgi:hypothetical protein